MCGIIGHIAYKASQCSREAVLDGLAYLEYRGYDSAGIALASPDRLDVHRALGKLTNLSENLDAQPPADAFVGIGYTHWAAHGHPTVMNAYLHSSPDGRFSLVRSGIIENTGALRATLIVNNGTFASEIDTEAVVRLLARTYDRTGPASSQGAVAGLTGTDEKMVRHLVVTLRAVAEQLHGVFTLLMLNMQSPSVIVTARRSSPLVASLGERENFLGSDALAFVEHTNRAIEVDQDEVVVVSVTDVTVIDPAGDPVERGAHEVDFSSDRATKDGWLTSMEKGIREQPGAVGAALTGRIGPHGHLVLDGVRIPQHVLRSVSKVIIIGRSTTSYAGQVARYTIERWCRVPVEVKFSGRFRYRDSVIDEKILVVAISQGSETMDTIQATCHVRGQGMKVVTVVNTPGSAILRGSDTAILTHASPEIAVASTKAFTTQATACYILGLYLTRVRGSRYADEIVGYTGKLGTIPDATSCVLDSGESVRQFVRTMQNVVSVIYLGRHVGFPVALEGALKFKEICYIRTEDFIVGELKHGLIVLVDEGQPVIIIMSTPRCPELHGKVLANTIEAHTRGAHTIIVAEKGNSSAGEFAEIVLHVPAMPILYALLLTVVSSQTFIYELVAVKDLGVDQSRSLAKSVTME